MKRSIRRFEDLGPITGVTTDDDKPEHFLRTPEGRLFISRLLAHHVTPIQRDLREYPSKKPSLSKVPVLALALGVLWPLLNFAGTNRRENEYAVQKLRIRIGREVVNVAKQYGVKLVWSDDQRARAGQWLLNSVIRHGYFVFKDNPTTGIKRIKNKTDGFHTWSEEEIEQFEARHPVGSKARLALALLLHTAQRRSDVVKMGRQHVRGNSVKLRQQKTGTMLTIPLHAELAEIIAATPNEHLTFLTTGFGKPFTAPALAIGSASVAMRQIYPGSARPMGCENRLVGGLLRPVAAQTS